MCSSKCAYATPPDSQLPSSPFGVMAVQEGMSSVTLEDGFSTLPAPVPKSWLSNGVKVTRFYELKDMILGTCRLLYGSDRFKFYDIIIGSDEEQATFCAALVCSKDGFTKILRTISSDCPVKATELMVNQLQKDVMSLLVNFGAGTQLAGQQGYTNALTGTFELAKEKKKMKPNGAVDDTDTLVGRGIDSYIPNGPKGSRFNRGGFKRPRGSECEGRMADKMDCGEANDGLQLNYD